MKIVVFFVEITEYNLARIYNVYEKFSDIQFDYVYFSKSVSGHTTNRELPENAIVLSGSYSEKQHIVNRMIKQNNYHFAIINGYSDKINSYTIFQCRKRKIPYAIETDTQLNVPASIIKAVIKSLYLKKIFSGNAYGFAGGTRQKELFYYYGMNPSHVYLMPMTVDVEFFQKEVKELPTKAELKESKGYKSKRIVLYVGRFAPEKDLPTLLKAIKGVYQKHNDIMLCLVGKGPEKENLERLCDTLEIQEIVDFIPYMGTDELVKFYKMTDVFVLPSSFEPWGLVVNEALACGLPVIASDKVGAVDDLIVKDENGDIFLAGDSFSLRTLLEKWLYNTDGAINDTVMKKWNHIEYLRLLTVFLSKVEEKYVTK